MDLVNDVTYRVGRREFQRISDRRASRVSAAGPVWPTVDLDPPYVPGVWRPRRMPVVVRGPRTEAARQDREVRQARADQAVAEQIPWSGLVVAVGLIASVFVAIVGAAQGVWS